MSIHQSYSKLLIQDEPLQVLPALAVEVGLNEAIVLQQIHYWMNPRRNMGSIHEGKKWIYNTYEGWRENFPFWSLRTIQGIILKLEREELIESTDRFNTDTRDRTKWYTINYEHPILCAGDANSAHSMSTQILRAGDANLACSTIEQRIPTEKTSETSSSGDEGTTDGAKTPSMVQKEYDQAVFDTFWSAYPRKVAKGDARKAFNKVIKTVPLHVLIDSVEKHKKSEQWKDPKFIPHPATWLNGERWEDDLTKPAAQGGGKVVRKADTEASQKAWDDIMRPYYEGTHDN